MDMDIELISDKWMTFNTFVGSEFSEKKPNDHYISATQVKNYLMKDPILDWLKNYYKTLGLNTPDEIKMKLEHPSEWIKLHQKRTHKMTEEQNNLNVLFEKGNQFEAMVEADIMSKFPHHTAKLENPSFHWDNWERLYCQTVGLIKKGVPIIFQGVLINHKNKTFGVPDIIIRSDYLDKLFTHSFYNDEKNISAPKLNGEYHYVIIDIKFSSLVLASNGENLLNSKLFPAYKGQLLIYTAGLGEIQGYTPEKAFIMGKSYKYTTIHNKKNIVSEGFNCYDRLGVINYETRDTDYIHFTIEALKWIRKVRSEGDKWTVYPQPTNESLYPNMCNTQYDAPYHQIKKEIADNLEELTSLWMVGVKNRENAHQQGVFRYSDPRCNAKTLGITGKKIAPVLDKMISMLHNRDNNIHLIPTLIQNNDHDWQTKYDIEFFVDYEAIQLVFDKSQQMNILNSKTESCFIFMIGVGFENHHGVWEYKNLHISDCNLGDQYDIINKELDLITRFQQFIEYQITQHMIANNITNPSLCFPRFFHWGNAETSLLNSSNRRHGHRFNNLINYPHWIDMLTVFRGEPIIIKGVKKFGLKEIAKHMYDLGLIKTKWEDDGPNGGMMAMQDAIKFYNINQKIKSLPIETHNELKYTYSLALGRFANVVDYNEIDCKVVWEIINYLRHNHT
jgi:hypothetical protein